MQFTLKIEAGSFEKLSDAIHELKEILHELESLTDSDLQEELKIRDYETEGTDSFLTISEAEY